MLKIINISNILVKFILFLQLTAFSQYSNIDSLKKIIKSSTEDTNKVNSRLQLSNALLINDRINMEAKESAKEAVRLSIDLHYSKGVLLANYILGSIYSNQGYHNEALAFYEKSLKLSEKIGDKRNMGNALNYMGSCYLELGDYPTALEYFFKSLKIREEIKDKIGIGTSYFNISTVYTAQGNLSSALEKNAKALAIYTELKNSEGVEGA